MQTQNIIERAFQLARATGNLDEIKKTLRMEGYSNVDAHLAGASIKADLKKQFVASSGVRPVDKAWCGRGRSAARTVTDRLTPAHVRGPGR